MLNFIGDVGALQGVLMQLGVILVINVFRQDLSLEDDFINSIFRRRT